MQINNFFYRTQDFFSVGGYALRWPSMVSEKAKHKARVLGF